MYTLILSASCNYGDFFQYSITRETPAEFAWPDDLNALREKPSEEMMQQCREQIRREIQNRPDLVKGAKNFNQFRNVWNTHLSAAKEYQEWKILYDNLEITGSEDKCDPEETRQLVHIFRQYIHMLSERANSNTHSDFERCYQEFSAGKGEDLSSSFQYIDSLLHTYEELLYPDSIPKLSFVKHGDSLENEWINDAEKLTDDTFLNEYLRIFVIPSNGIGCPRILEDVQSHFRGIPQNSRRPGMSIKLSRVFLTSVLSILF